MWKYCFEVLGHSLGVDEDQGDPVETEPPRTGIPTHPGVSQGGIYRDKGPRRLRLWEKWGQCNSGSLGYCQAGRERSLISAAAAAVGRHCSGGPTGGALSRPRSPACELPGAAGGP